MCSRYFGRIFVKFPIGFHVCCINWYRNPMRDDFCIADSKQFKTGVPMIRLYAWNGDSCMIEVKGNLGKPANNKIFFIKCNHFIRHHAQIVRTHSWPISIILCFNYSQPFVWPICRSSSISNALPHFIHENSHSDIRYSPYKQHRETQGVFLIAFVWWRNGYHDVRATIKLIVNFIVIVGITSSRKRTKRKGEAMRKRLHRRQYPWCNSIYI